MDMEVILSLADYSLDTHSRENVDQITVSYNCT